MFEVEEQGCFEAGDVEVAKHLGEMAFVEGGDDLGIDDDEIIDNEVGDQGTDVLAVVTDEEFPLHLTAQPLFGEFNHQGPLVKLFIQTGLEGVEDLHGGTDDDFGEFFVVGEHNGNYLTTDFTDGHG